MSHRRSSRPCRPSSTPISHRHHPRDEATGEGQRAMTIPTAFDVAGSVVDDVHGAAAQEALSRAKAARVRPLCLCQSPGVEMYIAAGGPDLIVKRMPGTATVHDHRCHSWLPPDELSGYGAVAEQSIVDNPADGTTALRLGFSLSKAGNRAAP